MKPRQPSAVPAARPAPATPEGDATQRDIARLAGVSQSVVSRVFGGGGYVSERARARVLAAGAKAGYVTNAGARALKTGSSNITALIVANVTNAFYPYLFDELTRTVQAQGREIMLFNASGGRDIDELLPTVLRYKARQAILLTAGLGSTMAARLRERGVQTVMLNRYSLDRGSSSVTCDNVGGGRMVAEAFLAKGMTRFAYVGGEPDSSTNRDRRSGFLTALRRARIAPMMAEDGRFTHDWGFEAGERLGGLDGLQGVFCADDDIAMGVIDRLRFRFGRRIPEDIAVAGFDDVPGAAWPPYELTTVRQPVDDMIVETLRLLTLEHSTEPAHIRIPGTLIRRSSF